MRDALPQMVLGRCNGLGLSCKTYASAGACAGATIPAASQLGRRRSERTRLSALGFVARCVASARLGTNSQKAEKGALHFQDSSYTVDTT